VTASKTQNNDKISNIQHPTCQSSSSSYNRRL